MLRQNESQMVQNRGRLNDGRSQGQTRVGRIASRRFLPRDRFQTYLSKAQKKMKNASENAEPGIRRRTRVLPLIVLGLCVAVLVALVHRLYDNEPRYDGQRLMDWVEQLGTPGTDQKRAQAAVCAIGPKAIPFLLRSVRQNAWQQNKVAVWNKLPAQIQDFVPAPDSDYDLRLNKVPIALSLLGGAALPSLITASQDRNADVQFVGVRAIGMMGLAAESALPTLIRLLSQTNNDIGGVAALAIGQMGSVRTQAIAALATALPSTVQAARTLGAIGPEAQAAVPALSTLLDSPKEYVRVQAATALWQITQKIIPFGFSDMRAENRKAQRARPRLRL
jgi:hypothetical protein